MRRRPRPPLAALALLAAACGEEPVAVPPAPAPPDAAPSDAAPPPPAEPADLATTLVCELDLHVSAATLSADGARLVAGSPFWGTLTVRDLPGCAAPPALDAPELAGGLGAGAVSPDGFLLAVGGPSGRCEVWDLPTGERLIEFAGAPKPVERVLWTRDGGSLIAASPLAAPVLRLDLGGGEPTSLLDDIANDLALSADGATLAVAGDEGALTLVDLADGAPPRALAGAAGWLHAVALAPDRVAVAGEEGFAWVFSREDGALAWEVDLGGVVADLAFAPDGTLLAAVGEPFEERDGGGPRVVALDPATGAVVGRTAPLRAEPAAVLPEPGGDTALAVTLDGGLWRAALPGR